MEQTTDLEISTEQAQHLLVRWLGTRPQCKGLTRLTGGMLNSVLRLEFDADPYQVVVKMSSADDADFDGERQRLDFLRAHTAMRCPQVHAVGAPDEVVPYHSLLLECLPGLPLTAVRLDDDERRSLDRHLADIVLELHSHGRATFGAPADPRGEDDWAEIVVARLRDMRDGMPGRLPDAVLADIDTAVEMAPEAFRDQGEPCLIHGDLWAGNIMVEQTGGQWQVTGFIDPGLYYADVENELAYLQCFDTVGPAFFDVYTAHTPLRPGFENRRLYYWLNTMMIHVWLFGDTHYCRRAASLAAAIVETGVKP